MFLQKSMDFLVFRRVQPETGCEDGVGVNLHPVFLFQEEHAFVNVGAYSFTQQHSLRSVGQQAPTIHLTHLNQPRPGCASNQQRRC